MTSKELTIGAIQLTSDEIRDAFKTLSSLKSENGFATIDEETLKTIQQKLFISYHDLNTIVQGLKENAQGLIDDEKNLTNDRTL